MWFASWEPLLQSCPTRITGLDHWETGPEWVGACNYPNSALGRLSSYLQHPSSRSRPAALLICRVKTVMQYDQQTQWGAGLPDSVPQMKSLAGRRAWSALAKAGELGQHTWKLHSPTTLRHTEQVYLTIHKAKLVSPFSQGTWRVGQLELRPQTKSLTRPGVFRCFAQAGGLIHKAWPWV